MRVSIAKLSAVVTVAAVNLMVARPICLYESFAVFGFALTLATLQVAAFRLIRGQARIFRAGFAVAGSGTFGSLIWLSIYVTGPPDDSLIGRIIWDAWANYLKAAVAVLSRLPYGMPLFNMPTSIPMRGSPQFFIREIVVAVLLFIPQLLIALAGGFLARQVAKRWSIAPVQEGPTVPGDVETHEK